MKKYALIFFALLAVLPSCTSNNGKTVLTRSTGKPFDVYVVMGDAAWQGAPGDSIRVILQEAVPYIFQYEPRLSIFRILPKNFKGLVANHRNIIVYRTSPELSEPSMSARYNVYSDPQLIVTIAGPNDSVLVKYMSKNRESLLRVFEIAERDRAVTLAKRTAKREINEKVKEKFGIDISIPQGYLVKGERNDFMWMTYEHPLATQGIMIYKYPLAEVGNFTEEKIIAQRNKYARYVPGPEDGSYMTTTDRFIPYFSSSLIDGWSWYVMRGYWDVENYPTGMGGPFVNYTTITRNEEVISVDFFVFSPKNDKRNYIRQSESLIHTVTLPDGEK